VNVNGFFPAAQHAGEFLRQAELVVGIASHNNASTIRGVVRTVFDGLGQYFPQFTSVVVHVDAGSTDNTRQEVLAARAGEEHLLTFGEGASLRLILDVAARLGARACAIVNPDVRSISPAWVDSLVRPVLFAHIDLVAPEYHRHKFDGAITHQLVYPMTRMLYGSTLRPQVGGEFAMSRRLIERLLSRPDWEEHVPEYGPDIWIATIALAEKFAVCQSFLGQRAHDAQGRRNDLVGTLRRVTGSLFTMMLEWERIWQCRSGPRAAPHFGCPMEMSVEPRPVDVEPMIAAFRQGARDLEDVWRIALSRTTLGAVRKTVNSNPFEFRDDLWVRVIFDLACAFKDHPWRREHVTSSLAPLYMGRLASFLREIEAMPAEEVAARVEQLCFSFEKAKPDLIRQWNGHSTLKEAPRHGRYVSSPA